jgi:hypothetical protein
MKTVNDMDPLYKDRLSMKKAVNDAGNLITQQIMACIYVF